jgi:hypothetical protein
MAKVHEYLLVLPDGQYEFTKSHGPICFQQSRQEVGGHFETFDPQLGKGFIAQINADGGRLNLPPNSVFKEIAGNVLIGRTHGAEMWGLDGPQREELLLRLQLTGRPQQTAPVPESALEKADADTQAFAKANIETLAKANTEK